jgi:hypothetical protein
MTSEEVYDNIETLTGTEEAVIALFKLFGTPIYGERPEVKARKAGTMREILLHYKNNDVPFRMVVKEIKRTRKKYEKKKKT